jgi:uncharacterized ion transporter superfamily protein YfcC
MKIGWIEIVLIIFVVIAVAVIARIIRPGRIASQQSNSKESDAAVVSTENKTGRRSSLLARTGIALIAAGGIALIAGVSMLQWVLHNYVLSSVLIICGVVIFVLSRRKR